MERDQKTTPLPLDQEIQAAAAIVRIGLERLTAAATRTDRVGPHVAALLALYDVAHPDRGILGAVADVIGTINVSASEIDHDDVERTMELLDEASGYVQDSTGERIRLALDLLGPLAKRCDMCRQTKPDVETMPDPFTTAMYPEATDHLDMTLCGECATKRFEES